MVEMDFFMYKKTKLVINRDFTVKKTLTPCKSDVLMGESPDVFAIVFQPREVD
jgi:hypothetical protein